jgi:hypothetical protein
VPDFVSKASQLWWHVTVKVPRSLHSLRSLHVSAQILKVSGLLPSTLVSDVEIRTTSASIDISNLNVRAARIKTTNGDIKGSFNVSRALSLVTSNGAIDAQVSLVAPTLEDRRMPFPMLPPPPPGGPHSLREDTRFENPPAVQPHPGDVYGPPPPGFPPLSRLPSYYRRWLQQDAEGDVSPTVIVSTSNGAVDLKYVDHPADLGLHSFVQTTNGRAHVTHPPAYAGDFEVRASLALDCSPRHIMIWVEN